MNKLITVLYHAIPPYSRAKRRANICLSSDPSLARVLA